VVAHLLEPAIQLSVLSTKVAPRYQSGSFASMDVNNASAQPVRFLLCLNQSGSLPRSMWLLCLDQCEQCFCTARTFSPLPQSKWLLRLNECEQCFCTARSFPPFQFLRTHLRWWQSSAPQTLAVLPSCWSAARPLPPQ